MKDINGHLFPLKQCTGHRLLDPGSYCVVPDGSWSLSSQEGKKGFHFLNTEFPRSSLPFQRFLCAPPYHPPHLKLGKYLRHKGSMSQSHPYTLMLVRFVPVPLKEKEGAEDTYSERAGWNPVTWGRRLLFISSPQVCSSTSSSNL